MQGEAGGAVLLSAGHRDDGKGCNTTHINEHASSAEWTRHNEKMSLAVTPPPKFSYSKSLKFVFRRAVDVEIEGRRPSDPDLPYLYALSWRMLKGEAGDFHSSLPSWVCTPLPPPSLPANVVEDI